MAEIPKLDMRQAVNLAGNIYGAVAKAYKEALADQERRGDFLDVEDRQPLRYDEEPEGLAAIVRADSGEVIVKLCDRLWHCGGHPRNSGYTWTQLYRRWASLYLVREGWLPNGGR